MLAGTCHCSRWTIGEALRTLSVDTLLRGFQVDDSSNPLLGASARVQILQRLGESLRNLPEIFGPSGRPGQIAGQLPVNVI